MKTLRLFFSIVLLFFVGSLISSFTVPLTPVDNGVEVEVVKDEVWQLRACGIWVLSTRTTHQYINFVTHMRTTMYHLPEGNCAIPTEEEGARREVWGDGYWATFTPSGLVIVKQVFNPIVK